MAYKRKAKPKEDMNKNPDQIDLSRGRELLKQGKVKILKK